MSLNPNDIDLNSDAVPGDRSSDLVNAVNVLEPTIRVSVSATEILTEPSNSQGHVEGSSFEELINETRDFRGVRDSAESFGGSDAEGVDLNDGSERETGFVDRGTNVKASHVSVVGVLEDEGGDGRIRVAETLDCSLRGTELSLGRAGSGVGVEIAAIDEGLGLDSTDDVVKIGASCGDLLGFEIGRGGTEGNIMGGVEEDPSIRVKVLEEKNCNTHIILAETGIDSHGENLSMCDEREEKVVQAAEMFSGVLERVRNTNPHVAEEILNHGACVTVVPNLSPEGTSLIQNTVNSVSVGGEAEPKSSPVTEFVEQLPDKNPVMEVEMANTNDSLPDGNQNAVTYFSVGLISEGLENQQMEVEKQADIDENQIEGVHVSEARVPQYSGEELNVLGLVVDFNPYVCADGFGVGVSNEGTEVRDVSGDDEVSVSGCIIENAACHVDGVGLNGIVEEQATDINKPKATGKKIVKSAASKSRFFVSDLVWGKVRSHPWWPGQIFDPSDSSKKAMKYFKEDSFLIAYFGDGTFAWNEASRLKPFQAYFSQMEKQSNMEAFRHAVDCALDEISRRVEFGLACSCLSEEVYAKIKSQIVINAGIREESRRRDSGEEFSSAASFEPVKLFDNIRSLAKFPYGEVDRLELVIAQAQLLSFYRWKGYYYLPEFKMLGGLLENDGGIPLLRKKQHHSEVSKDEGQIPIRKGRVMSQDSSSRKRKQSSDDSMYPSKKERSLSDLMARNRSYLLNGENESEGKAGSKLISSSSGRKRKEVESISDDDSAPKNQKRLMSTGAASKSPKSEQTFRVGDRIRRVASQLNRSTPILRYGGGTSQKIKVLNRSKEKSANVSFGVSPYSSEKTQRRKKVIPAEWLSPDEMVSQLCVAAIDPMKGYDFLVSMVSFFTDFRNSVCLDRPSSWKLKQYLEEKSDSKTGKKSFKAETTETSELEYVEDSYWTDRIIENIPEEQLLLENQDETGQFMDGAPIEKGMLTVESEAARELNNNLNFKQKTAGGNLELEAEDPVGHMNSKEETSPTALILNFTDLDSVPSETNLNKIFSRYGPLNESETEVLSKSSRAKVVFKRRSDAETAFSSAGKFSIFGPSLVSYRLKYSPSTPRKASSPAIKQSRKDSACVEGNAT